MLINRLILLMLCLLASCGRGEDGTTVVTEFPINDTLRATPIALPQSLILDVGKIAIHDDVLLMYSWQKDTVFDLFKLPNCDYIGGVGLKGMGPEDISDVENASLVSTTGGFHAYLIDRSILMDFSVDGGKINILDTVYLPFANANRVQVVDDSVIFYINEYMHEDKMELCRFSRETNRTTFCSPLPYHWIIDGEIPPSGESSVFWAHAVSELDGGRSARFYSKFKRFRIYDCFGAILKDVSLEIEPYSNTFTSDYSKPLWNYYSYPQACGDYIYVLCRNLLVNGDYDATELQVWNWDGEPIARYTLDTGVFLIAISQQHNKIYALDDENMLFSFPLPL